MNSSLSQSEFFLVREKISAKLTSSIVVAWPFNIGREANSEKGEPEKTERLWPGYLEYMNAVVEKLDGKERELGRRVIQKFVHQCDSFSRVTFAIPALKTPRIDYKQYFSMAPEEKAKIDDRNKIDSAEFWKKLESINNRVLAGQEEIVSCLKSVAPDEK